MALSIALFRRRRLAKNKSWLVSPQPAQPTAQTPEAGSYTFVIDRLEQIRGLGPLYARRLNQNGILTYAALADLSPAMLQSIVAPQGPLGLPVEDWLAEARRLARRVEEL